MWEITKKYQFRVDSKDVDIAQYIHIAHGTILECGSAQVCSLPAPCRIWHLHTGDILLQKLATPGNANRTSGSLRAGHIWVKYIWAAWNLTEPYRNTVFWVACKFVFICFIYVLLPVKIKKFIRQWQVTGTYFETWPSYTIALEFCLLVNIRFGLLTVTLFP